MCDNIDDYKWCNDNGHSQQTLSRDNKTQCSDSCRTQCCQSTAPSPMLAGITLQTVVGSMTFSDLALTDDNAKNAFKAGVASALATSLNINTSWVNITLGTSRRLDPRRLGEVTASYTINIP